jgi:hypothetical protein
MLAPATAASRAAFPLRAFFLTALVAFTWHVRYLQPLHPIDDAHITFRHAANFLAGHGWVFNVGDTFLCTSTPLYMLLLTAIEGCLRTGNLPAVAINCNMLFDGLLVALFYLGILDSRNAPLRSFLLSLPIALYPRLLDYSGCGMESSLFSLLILSAGWFWSRERWLPAGALFGAVILTRPDGIIPAVACLALSWNRPSRAIRAASLTAAIASSWYLFAWVRYGSPLPVTVANKVNPGGFGNLPTLWLLFGEVSPASARMPAAMAMNGHGVEGLSGFLWVSGWSLVLYLRKQGSADVRKFATYLLGATLLFFSAYLIGSPALYGWYQVPMGVMLLTVIALGQQAALAKLEARHPRLPAGFAPALLSVISILGWGNRLNYFPRSQPRFSLIVDWNPRRETEYRRLGLYLAGLADKGDAVFMQEPWDSTRGSKPSTGPVSPRPNWGSPCAKASHPGNASSSSATPDGS